MMGDSFQSNVVTPKTIFRLEEEGSHFHPTSRGQVVPIGLLYQPYGRPLQQASAGSKDLSLAAGAGFDGFLGTTVADEDDKRNFEARTGFKELNAVFNDEVVTLLTGHGLIAVGNGTESVSGRQLVGSSITNSLAKGALVKFVAGKFEEALTTNVAWGEYIEEVETDVFRIRIFQNSVITP